MGKSSSSRPMPPSPLATTTANSSSQPMTIKAMNGHGGGGGGNNGSVDPDELFETKTVDEIAELSRSLARDVDRKREELRTMVGERYRDLMEAADTIARMREGAEAVIASVDGAVNSGREAHARAVQGFRNKGGAASLTDEADCNAPYLAVAAEIKLLMTVPEKMWAAVDRGDHLTAARLFLFARHIHTGLTLERQVGHAKNEDDDDDEDDPPSSAQIVAKHFPVVSRQWASISHFREAILQGAEAALAEEGLPDRAVEAMAAAVLLRGLSAEKVLDEYLDRRAEALRQRLRRDAKDETAKGVICRSVTVVLNTVRCINRAFTSPDGDDKSLAIVLKRASEPAVGLFQTRLSPVFKHLPAIVRDFRPSALEPLRQIDPPSLAAKTKSWLDSVHDVISSETASALAHVGSIGALSGVRRGCYEFLLEPEAGGELDPGNWESLCRATLGAGINLWDEFYRRAFRDRMEALISSHAAGASYCVQSTLAEDSESFDEELDLSARLWSETGLGEIEYSYRFGGGGGGGLSSGRAARPSPTQMRAHGYSKRVQDLCAKLDQLLERLLEELRGFAESGTTADNAAEAGRDIMFLSPEQQAVQSSKPFDLVWDVKPVLDFAQESVVGHLRDLLDHVSGRYLNQSGDSSPSSLRGLFLFLGRFFQALPELCPNVERCAAAARELAREAEDRELVVSVAALQQRRAAAAKVDPRWAELKAGFERCSQQVTYTQVTQTSSFFLRTLGLQPCLLLPTLPL